VRSARIAVTGFLRSVEDIERTGVNAAYMTAVLAGGGLPIVLSPLLGAELAEAALEHSDGLLLTGGADIDPARFGAAPSPALGSVEPARDAFEFALLETAMARQLPILAVCRGMQLVNVAAAGSLWQDLPTELPGQIRHRQAEPRTTPTHAVRIEGGTRTASILGGRLRTNSSHHQAIRELGRGLRATGWADDGIVEAMESDDAAQWLVGVQWHPEEGSAGPPDRNLFRAFVEAASQASSPSPR
jgi:putative glutamine amidotransferase